jgi:uncharacterized membrane protein
MIALLFGFYIGLFIFAINGLLLHAVRAKQIELRAQEDRIRRLLMAARIKRLK